MYTHGILSHFTFLTGIVLILQNTASHTPGSLQWSHWCYLSRRENEKEEGEGGKGRKRGMGRRRGEREGVTTGTESRKCFSDNQL